MIGQVSIRVINAKSLGLSFDEGQLYIFKTLCTVGFIDRIWGSNRKMAAILRSIAIVKVKQKYLSFFEYKSFINE